MPVWWPCIEANGEVLLVGGVAGSGMSWSQSTAVAVVKGMPGMAHPGSASATFAVGRPPSTRDTEEMAASSELREFLRSRRAALDPEDVGLPAPLSQRR